MEIKKSWGALAACVALTACGGGGDGGSGTIGGPNGGGNPPGGSNGWTQGVFLPSSSFKNQCENPRSGTDPDGQPFPDTKGSVLAENNWLRSWTNELYLWYDEVVDRNPGSFSTLNYFDLLKTTQTTASGTPKDKPGFHFTWPTDEWEAFTQSGVTAGYGAAFRIVSDAPPRQVVVLFVEPGSPAASAGVLRGDEVVAIDGFSIDSTNPAPLNAGLFPAAANESHTFALRNDSGTRNATMVSANVTSAPVHTVDVLPTTSGNVGYILFNDHIATAEDGLINAIETLKAADVKDLVLDLRYNGGGTLVIASQLAYMIAGSSNTAGQVFERMVWNNKHPTTNPVTGAPLAPMPFIDETLGLSRTAGAPLPTLNLPRVYVLTSGDTCSASESIINGLAGVRVDVIQIGTTTCGKPYGFYAFDNCGTTYFSIQFKGVNQENFGEYTDGFSPENTATAIRGTLVPGCAVNDDLDHQLGDPAERMLSVALTHRMGAACPTPPTSMGQSKMSSATEATGKMARPPYREIRRVRPGDFAL